VDFSEDFVFFHGLYFHQFGGSANVRTRQPHRLARPLDARANVVIVDVFAVPSQQEIHLVIRRQPQVLTAPRHQITWNGGFEIKPGFHALVFLWIIYAQRMKASIMQLFFAQSRKHHLKNFLVYSFPFIDHRRLNRKRQCAVMETSFPVLF
jgi:hypothetical protein